VFVPTSATTTGTGRTSPDTSGHLNRLFQGHLDLLAVGEERRAVTWPGRTAWRARGRRGWSLPLVTRFGQVTVSRIAYRSPGMAS
jgi:hypothetical protein